MSNFLKTILIAVTLMVSHGCQNATQSAKQIIYSGVDQMVEEAMSAVQTISIAEFKKLFDAQEMYLLVDVREGAEHDQGYIPGTINIPRGLLEFWIEKEAFWEDEGMYTPLKDDKLIIYCKSGRRSALAVESLEKLGFTDVYSLEGGFTEWKIEFPDDVQDNKPAVTLPQGSAVSAPQAAGGC